MFLAAVAVLMVSVIGLTAAIADDSTADSSSTIYINGDWSSSASYYQNIVVNGDTVIVSGTTVYIYGKLTVNEGCTLTIEDGAQLIVIAYGSNTGSIVNNGTISVESALDSTLDGGLVVTGVGASLYNYGTVSVTSDSTAVPGLNAGSTTIVYNYSGATVEVGEYSYAVIKSTFTNAGTLKVDGTFQITEVSNSGTVTIDGTTDATGTGMTVKLTTTDARLVVTGLTAGADFSLVVSDYYKNSTTDNSITVSLGTGESVSGLTFAIGYADEASYLDISGTVAVGDEDTHKVGIDLGGAVRVTGELTLGKGITMTAESGTLLVSGTVTSTSGTIAANTGKITVTGSILTSAAISDSQYVSSALYVSEKVYHYTTFAAALSSGATAITLLGTLTIDAHASVASGVTVTIDQNATVTVGSSVELSFVSGSKLVNNGTVDVDGVLYFAAASGFRDKGTTTCDVAVSGDDGSATYCNLPYALSKAGEGDTISLHGDATLSASATIPSGVTLDTDGHTLTVSSGATLTVSGTLHIEGNADTYLVLDGSIALEGTITSDSSFSEAIVAGAYYEADGLYCICTVEDAASVITTADNRTVTIRGAAVAVDSVSFAGTSDETVYVVISSTSYKGSISLSYAQLTVSAGTAFEGTVTGTSGNIDADLDTITTDFVFLDDGSALSVSGVASTGTLGINDKATVSGTLTVTCMTVEGTLTVASTGKLTVNGDLVVTGTVDNSGSLQATRLFAGISAKYVVGTDATVSGTGTFTIESYAIVSAGSTVASAVLSNVTASTEFYVDDSLYITAYAKGTSTLPFSSVLYNVEDSAFLGWYSGTTNVSKTGVYVGKCDTVSASVETDVYLIIVRAATGISDVFLDGVLMTYGQITDSTGSTYYAFHAYAAAGSHTISYNLSGGYSGDATLYVNGEKQTSLKFTATGTPTVSDYEFEYVEYSLQLTGVSIADDGKEDESGLAVTEILLIALVVLIAVLAVIIAVRLMRD